MGVSKHFIFVFTGDVAAVEKTAIVVGQQPVGKKNKQCLQKQATGQIGPRP